MSRVQTTNPCGRVAGQEADFIRHAHTACHHPMAMMVGGLADCVGGSVCVSVCAGCGSLELIPVALVAGLVTTQGSL